MTLNEFLENIFTEVLAQLNKLLDWIRKNLVEKV